MEEVNQEDGQEDEQEVIQEDGQEGIQEDGQEGIQESQEEKDIAELEALIGIGDDANVESNEEVLFAIVSGALKDPENFGADDVITVIKSFGREDIIDEASIFNSEDFDPESDGLEDAEVDELMSAIRGR